MIQVKNQSVQINGEDIILFGGELHYFRVPKSEWRNRIVQAKQAGINMISTYVPWGFHEMEEGKIDLEGKTLAERDLAAFLQIVKEENMYCLVRPGPYVMAEVVDHGVPTWFIDNYPEAVAKTVEGENHPTRVVSYLHPTYLEKVNTWYEHVCRIIEAYQISQGGPVILFQLDNEVGMFHWVTNTGDYNSDTQHRFTEYLKESYDLEAFNEKFHVNVNSIDQFVAAKLTQPEEGYALAMKNEYSLFMREHYKNYISYLKQLALGLGIHVPFVINVHGFDTIESLKRGKKYPIGLSQLLEVAQIDDVLTAGDYYIGNIDYDNFIDIVMANAFTKSIQNKNQPLFSAEFQGGTIPDKPRLQPSTYDLTTRLCFANGMNAANYYMFVGGENYENIGILGRRHEWQAPLTASGKERPHFKVIQHLGKVFQVYEKSLAKSKPAIDTHIAFYPDYFMTEFSNSYTKKVDDSLLRARETNVFDGVARGLRLNNIVFDAINVQAEEKMDVRHVPTLWMFASERMDEAVQRKLVNYLEDGGKLVLFPVIPVKNLNGESCTILKDYIGVEVNGAKGNGFVRVNNVDSVKVDGVECYAVETGAFGWSEDEDNAVVAFEKELGKGKLVMFGVSMQADYEYKNEIYRNVAALIDVRSSFTVEDELDISARVLDDGGCFVFVNNFDEYEKVTAITHQDKVLFDGTSITIPGKSGLILPVQVPLTDDLTIVYGTGEPCKLARTEQELSLEVKVNQAEEVFVFKSDTWIPNETGNVQVTKEEAVEEYKVNIQSSNDVEKITFSLKTVE